MPITETSLNSYQIEGASHHIRRSLETALGFLQHLHGVIVPRIPSVHWFYGPCRVTLPPHKMIAPLLGTVSHFGKCQGYQ